MNYIKNFYKGRHVLGSFVKQDFKNKYRNSVLGVAWAFLSPLGLVMVIGIVYSLVFKIAMAEFIPYLFSGIIPWTFISICAELGTTCYINAQGYIKQTQVPIEIFPARVVIGSFINLIISMMAFFMIYAIIGMENFSFKMLMMIPALAIWLLFGLGWASIVGIINLYIRDFQPLQGIIFQAFFYATPIIYKVDMIPKEYSMLYLMNPLYHLMEILRRPMLGDIIPPFEEWVISFFFSLIVFIIGIVITEKIGRKISFKL